MPNSASANGATKLLRSAQPRSPPLCAEPGSCEYCFASSAKSLPAFACASTCWACARAAASSLPVIEDVARVALLGHLAGGSCPSRRRRADPHRSRYCCAASASRRSSAYCRCADSGVMYLRLMALVVGLHGRIVDVGGGLELLGRQHEVAHLALLVLELGQALQLGRGEEIRARGCRPRAAVRCTSLRSSSSKASSEMPACASAAFAASGEYWPSIWNAGSLCTASRSAVVTHAVAQLLRCAASSSASRIRPSSTWSCSCARSCAGSSAPPRRCCHCALLAQPGVARILQGDLAAVRLGGVVGAAEIQVDDAVGAPGGEHQRRAAPAPGTRATCAIAARCP